MRGSRKKAVIALFCTAVLLFSTCFSTSAIEPIPDTSDAKSVYLWNVEHDKVIISRSDENVIFPASMTKIMTGLVAIDLVADKLDDKVTITKEMLSSKGTSMQLKAGEEISYRDLLYAAICGGFNDATTALAAASAGSVDAFVLRMNQKAKELGARNTNYTNPTGWHDDNMVTTLADTAIIAKAAMKSELYVKVSSALSYTIEKTNLSDSFTVHNRNGLIGSHYAHGYYNKRAKGLIAGMTDEGGHCVATFFEDSGLKYLCIIMGANEVDGVVNSYKIANSLISHIVYYYGDITVLKKGDFVTSVPVRLAVTSDDTEFYMLDCVTVTDISIFTPYNSASLQNIEFKPYIFSDDLTAPIEKGQVIGGVDIFVDGVLRGNADLCASDNVDANRFLVAMSNAKNMLSSRRFIIFLIVFVILFLSYFAKYELNGLRKRSKKIKFDRIY